MNKSALITGITGQDGSYLADFLLSKGYEVHGLMRRSSTVSTSRIEHIYQDNEDQNSRIIMHYGDLVDATGLNRLIQNVRPNEIYNLGAQSHVAISFDLPEFTSDSVGMGCLRILEAIRGADWGPRFYQAGSSEMYGLVQAMPQNERTPFYPRSPYAVAKVFAHQMTIQYREAYGIYACNGILFNHESPRRGGNFVTRKVTRGIADILSGKAESIALGNLEAKRDWGYAKEYVKAMWMMLQQDQPDDYVIATGETHSVQELVDVAFSEVGLNWSKYVGVDQRFFRPTEVDVLLGDASKAKRVLGWEPETSFVELVRVMLAADLRSAGVDLKDYPQLAATPIDIPAPTIRELSVEDGAKPIS